MINDSVCCHCRKCAVEGRYYPETLESPAEYPEPYCEVGNDENFGTPYGCWDYEDIERYEEE